MSTAPGNAKSPSLFHLIASMQLNWAFWITLVAFIVLWEVAARVVQNSLLLVSIPAIFARAVDMWQTQDLALDIQTSALEFALGFLIAAATGILAGTITGYWRTAGDAFNPFINAAYATPIIALGPLFIIAFGIGIWSKVAIVALAAFFPIALNTAAGIRATDRNFLELARAFGMNSAKTLFKISLPSSLPYILAGLGIAAGRGLTAIVAGELFGARHGLGLKILTAASTFDTAGVFVAAFILAMAGIVLIRFFNWLELIVAPWKR